MVSALPINELTWVSHGPGYIVRRQKGSLGKVKV